MDAIREVFRLEGILKNRADCPDQTKGKVIAVLPAYNAEKTLVATVADVPRGCVDEIILVDDGSTDGTVGLAGIWA